MKYFPNREWFYLVRYFDANHPNEGTRLGDLYEEEAKAVAACDEMHSQSKGAVTAWVTKLKLVEND